MPGNDIQTEADKLLEEIMNEEEDIGNAQPGQKTDDDPSKETTPPVDEKTKAYSERLKKDRERIKQETQAELAKAMGYDNWDSMLAKKHEDDMLEKGLDPDTVKPILKEMLHNDPDYIAAMEYRKEREEKEKEIWAENEIKNLNSKFGLTLSSIEDLGDEVIKLWNSGIPLDKAYAAEHYADLEKIALKRAISKGTGKEHLIDMRDKGNDVDRTEKKLTKEELRVFKILNPDASDDEISKYINKK